jgi:hypothetical protein
MLGSSHAGFLQGLGSLQLQNQACRLHALAAVVNIRAEAGKSLVVVPMHTCVTA